MIIKNATLQQQTGNWNIVIDRNHIKQVTTESVDETGEPIIDAEGALVLPPVIAPHIHLETTLTAGEPDWNHRGTLFEGIERWSERKQSVTKEDVKRRATQALHMQIKNGIQH